MHIDIKPLIANLRRTNFAGFLGTDDFDNAMLEWNYDEPWKLTLDSTRYDTIGDYKENAFIRSLETLYVDNKAVFHHFLYVSIKASIKSKKFRADFTDIIKALKGLEMPEELLDELIDLDNHNHKKVQISTNIQKKDLIFIGHGGSPIWRELKDYLNDEGFSCEAFETESRTAEHIIDILTGFLSRATFAIMVVTAEDKTDVGSLRARQNVIHEIGLFQGRLGFKRVAILKQEEAEDFSNNAGLQYISFHDKDIDQTFFKLKKALIREGIHPNKVK